jgi:dynein light intermediate chain 2
LFTVGERNSGKSSVLQAFLSYGKEETPKTTVALEYSFARAPLGVTAKRDVGHIYELGGGRLLSSLTGVVINPESLPGLAVIISLDLSTPHKVLDSLLFWLQGVKEEVRRAFAQHEPSLANKIR